MALSRSEQQENAAAEEAATKAAAAAPTPEAAPAPAVAAAADAPVAEKYPRDPNESIEAYIARLRDAQVAATRTDR